jgi:hypothetical protein
VDHRRGEGAKGEESIEGLLKIIANMPFLLGFLKKWDETLIVY